MGGEVRLATPPPPLTAPPTAPPTAPLVMVNGQTPQPQGDGPIAHQAQQEQEQQRPTNPLLPRHIAEGIGGIFIQHSSVADPPGGTSGGTGGDGHPPVARQDATDRTNVDEAEGFFTHELLVADWFDTEGARIPPCGIDEAGGLARTVIETLMRTAPSKEAFLLNLSALRGGKAFMSDSAVKVTRLEQLPDRNRYLCEWELRYGDISGSFAMQETVLCDKWKRKGAGQGQPPRPLRQHDGPTPAAADAVNEEAEYWQGMYKEVLAVMQRRDEDLARLRSMVMECMNKRR